MDTEIASGRIVRVPVSKPKGRPPKPIEPPAEGEPQLTILDIQKNPLYLGLTPAQQKFLIKFLETKDRIQASEWAYPATKHHDVNGLRVLRGGVIRKLVSLFFGQDPITLPLTKKELVTLVAGRIRIAESDEAFVKLVDMYAKLSGIYAKKPAKATEEEAEPEDDVDSLVRKLEGKKEK